MMQHMVCLENMLTHVNMLLYSSNMVKITAVMVATAHITNIFGHSTVLPENTHTCIYLMHDSSLGPHVSA